MPLNENGGDAMAHDEEYGFPQIAVAIKTPNGVQEVRLIYHGFASEADRAAEALAKGEPFDGVEAATDALKRICETLERTVGPEADAALERYQTEHIVDLLDYLGLNLGQHGKGTT